MAALFWKIKQKRLLTKEIKAINVTHRLEKKRNDRGCIPGLGQEVLTRSVNSPVTLPSTRWNFPPLSASSVAGAWVKAWTNCRKNKVGRRCMVFSGIQGQMATDTCRPQLSFQRHKNINALCPMTVPGSILFHCRPGCALSEWQPMTTLLEPHCLQRMIPSGFHLEDPKLIYIRTKRANTLWGVGWTKVGFPLPLFGRKPQGSTH